MLDTILAIALAILTIALAYLGVHVTLHPADSPESIRRYKRAFAVCGIAAVSLIGVQSYRTQTAQNHLVAKVEQIDTNTKTPAKIEVNLPPQRAYFGPEAAPGIANYKIGQYVAVTGSCKNFSQSVPAEDAQCWLRSFVVDTKLNQQNQAIVAIETEDQKFEEFQKTLGPLMEGERTTLGPGQSHFGSTSPGLLDDQLDRDLRLNFKKTILFLGEYSWRDGSGWNTDQACMWLQVGKDMGPMFPDPRAQQQRKDIPITWHNCQKHNGVVKK